VIDPIQAYLGSDSDLQIAGRARKLIPLPDLSEQPENVQRPGSEVVEKGMLT